MDKQKGIISNLESLMDMLASNDGMIRLKARESLVTLGKPGVPSLVQALQQSGLDQVRWEAAKTLGAIDDARSIPSLVTALEDCDNDVAWLAAEALSRFKKAAWPSLLQALINDKSDSALLCRGAHHVLLHQKEDGLNELLATLMKALEYGTIHESTTLAAYEILKRMEVNS
ncbi:MAG: HEAT repeat domain-containing protein [Syntrophaceae bacterium]|nr:HEAT repeat domain-containing protein [Syntrophaceae bacterium]